MNRSRFGIECHAERSGSSAQQMTREVEGPLLLRRHYGHDEIFSQLRLHLTSFDSTAPAEEPPFI